MASHLITGIQQAGIGVVNANEAKLLYKELFGMDVLIFEDKAEASLMTRYTGGELHERHAILSLNMGGGGGFEIWQFTSKKASTPIEPIQFGDLGIYAIKIKTQDVHAAHKHLQKHKAFTVSQIMTAPDNRSHFWLEDSYGNHFNIVEADDWFKAGKGICGGVVGAVIGVSNMQQALHFYKAVLGIDEVVYSSASPAYDVPCNQMKGKQFERVLLKKQVAKKGAFSKLLGSVQIELVQATETPSKKIFANRYWGDCGFIHLCFDVLHMDGLKQLSAAQGYPFTVDSQDSFAMGTSAGRFCYVEDPDGTLIELVETHKVPVLKKFGWYLNLKKRKHNKPLPDWIIGMLALTKVR